MSGFLGPNVLVLRGGGDGLLLCFLRVRGNGARCVGPVHAVHWDLELGGDDRRKLKEIIKG